MEGGGVDFSLTNGLVPNLNCMESISQSPPEQTWFNRGFRV